MLEENKDIKEDSTSTTDQENCKIPSPGITKSVGNTGSTALEVSVMDLVPDNGILNGLEIEIEEVHVQNILSLTSKLPNLEKIK